MLILHHFQTCPINTHFNRIGRCSKSISSVDAWRNNATSRIWNGYVIDSNIYQLAWYRFRLQDNVLKFLSYWPFTNFIGMPSQYQASQANQATMYMPQIPPAVASSPQHQPQLYLKCLISIIMIPCYGQIILMDFYCSMDRYWIIIFLMSKYINS